MISKYFNSIVLLRIHSFGGLYSPPGYGNYVIFRAKVEIADKGH